MSDYKQLEYTAGHVANFMLAKSFKEEIDVTPLKLQKLVYIGYGWVLAVLDKKLFDEQIYAWKHGPVIESLYHAFRCCGSDPISTLTQREVPFVDLTINKDTEFIETAPPPQIEESTEEVKFLEIVWDIYKNVDAWTLRGKTHETDTPWSRVYLNNKNDIPLEDDDIHEHFTSKIRSYIDGPQR